jgi:hypothetical protein
MPSKGVLFGLLALLNRLVTRSALEAALAAWQNDSARPLAQPFVVRARAKPRGPRLGMMREADWCADWYGKDYYRHSPRRNPQGPDEGTGRVVRGGSWVASGRGCRSAQRVSSVPWSRYNFVGFRVAVSVAPRPA